MIFYRLFSNSTDRTHIPNPANLPANQKLLFTPPINLANKFADSYTNNIVRVPPAQPGGRHVQQNDEGFAGWLLNIEGNLIQATGDSQKIHLFRTGIQEEDTYHPFGTFGIWYPNGPPYVQDDVSEGCPTGLSIDPDGTHGLMIVTATGQNVSVTKELVDFTMQLSYGGDL